MPTKLLQVPYQLIINNKILQARTKLVKASTKILETSTKIVKTRTILVLFSIYLHRILNLDLLF